MKSNVTKVLIRAIRECSYVGFRLNPSENGGEHGTTVLEAVLRASDQSREIPFRHDIDHQAEVEGFVTDYSGKRWGGLDGKLAYKGWASRENYTHEAMEPALLANLLRDGDCLRVQWVTGNSSEWSRAKGLYRDSCRVSIYRPVAGDKWKGLGSFVWEESVADHYINRVCQPIPAKFPRVETKAEPVEVPAQVEVETSAKGAS